MTATFLVASQTDQGVALVTVSASGIEGVTQTDVTDAFHLLQHPNLPVAYLTSGAGGGSVVTVGLTGWTGIPVSRLGGVGGFPCHQALSPDHALLATANYRGGSVSFLDVAGGAPVAVRSTVRLPYETHAGAPDRQDAAYPHTVHWLDDGAVLVPDLGSDVVWRVDPHSGAVEVAYRCPAGSGPRHLARDAEGRLWVSLELSSEVGLLVDEAASTAPATGRPLADGVRNYPGDIVGAGRWVVVANRGAHTLALYDSRAPRPALTAEVSGGGEWPAALAVRGTTVAAALRDSDLVCFFDVSDAGLTLVAAVRCSRPIAIAQEVV